MRFQIQKTVQTATVAFWNVTSCSLVGCH